MWPKVEAMRKNKQRKTQTKPQRIKFPVTTDVSYTVSLALVFIQKGRFKLSGGH